MGKWDIFLMITDNVKHAHLYRIRALTEHVLLMCQELGYMGIMTNNICFLFHEFMVKLFTCISKMSRLCTE